MSGLLRLGFWAAVVFAFVMAVLPQPPHLPGAPSDKLLHVTAFATLALLGSAAYAERSLLRLWLALSAFGAVIEGVQAIPVLHRDSSALDWVADTLAAALILVMVFFWRNRSN